MQHPISYGADSLPVVQAAMRAARERGAAELQPAQLLLSLTSDRAVSEALARSGASQEELQRAIAACPVSPARPGEDLTIAPAAWLVLHRAEQAALAREHVAVDPGHLLLGMLDEPPPDGVRVLSQAGADLAALAAQIDERLPVQPFDVEGCRGEAARHQKLSAEALERLLDDLGEWHRAVRSLRERRRAIAAGETPRVADEDVESVKRHAREHAAWIPLRDHHLHLAIAAADAQPAHDFGFTYLVARGAMFTACSRYVGPATEADFLRAVQHDIDTALERAFRQVAHAAAA